MQYEIENFEGTNNDIIEIVHDEVCYYRLKRIGNNNIKVFLPLCLSIGKLDGMDSFDRSNLHKYIKIDRSFNFKEDILKLKEIARNASKIRLWSSHLDTDDYCLLLFICYLFKDKVISVLFSDDMSSDAYTINTLADSELSTLIKKEHVLTIQEKDEYAKEWIRINNENTELRYISNGKVISCNIDYFDNQIIDRLKKMRKIYIFKLVADFMVNPIIPNVIYSDWIYIYLIERLEKIGIIKSYIVDNKKYIEV